MEEYITSGGLPAIYRCEQANRSQEEWWALGHKEFVLGVFCVIYGCVAIPLYFLVISALLQKELRKIVAYKLMLFLCCVDIVGIVPNSVISGVFFIQGAVYCNYPNFIYLWGCVCMGWWGGVCCGGFVLGITRLVDLFSSQLHDRLFGGKRITFSFLFIFAYQGYFLFFTRPVLFNSVARTWFFDPLIFPDGSHVADYACWALTFNNTGTVSVTLCLYFLFVIIFVSKYKGKGNLSKQTLQTTVICFNNMTLALIYVVMSYIHVTETVSSIGLLFWQMTTSGGIFVLLGLNKTVRGIVFKKIGLSRFVGRSSVAMSSNQAVTNAMPTQSSGIVLL